ncbi:hypothetical protein CXG81DRAFT_13865 [Caulochytrium protostelioides]|uniref:ClpP/crotonase n=1 Tax=Caulochytrium protostelioides TaxID=1555241 RepID=A0A4P9X4B3_9FUNG|nr:hypothetical protein CXG81DRAFT_13865 [Caulochytrium protostelioides]|eukprot:RKO99907.1 hypothetical protein CXG81DRAFT_13865 [Caulochytrium protostelioides]
MPRGEPLAAYAAFPSWRATMAAPAVLQLDLARPERLNALHAAMWDETAQLFRHVAQDPDVRCVVLTGGESRIFCAGIDKISAAHGMTDRCCSQVLDMGLEMETGAADRTALRLQIQLKRMQAAFTAIAECRVPVVAAVHGACIGAGIDMITACDIRIASRDARFSVKEVDLAIVADMGTLQRLPRVVGHHSWVRDICLTGRVFDAAEAERHGLVSAVLPDRDAAVEAAVATAACIASKSPVAVVGTKQTLNYTDDHTVADGLDRVATLNAALLQGQDTAIAIRAFLSPHRKSKSAVFPKL